MGTPTDEWVKTMFDSNERYLHDEGFTARVLGRLPPNRRRVTMRVAVILGSAAAAVAIALAFLGAGAISQAALAVLRYRPLVDPIPVVAVALVAVLITAWLTEALES
jgi:hypothetical protein